MDIDTLKETDQIFAAVWERVCQAQMDRDCSSDVAAINF